MKISNGGLPAFEPKDFGRPLAMTTSEVTTWASRLATQVLRLFVRETCRPVYTTNGITWTYDEPSDGEYHKAFVIGCVKVRQHNREAR